MLKALLILYAICSSFTLIAGTKFSFQPSDTTITGIAKNAKWGAVVITDNGATFYTAMKYILVQFFGIVKLFNWTKYITMSHKSKVEIAVRFFRLGGLPAISLWYYIDKKQEWETEFLDSKIEVQGSVKKQTFTEKDVKDEEGNYSQGMIGTKKTLYNSKIKIVNQ